MTLVYKVVVSACVGSILLYTYTQIIIIFLLSKNDTYDEKRTLKASVSHCTCENVHDLVGASVVDVTPSNLVCVDKRAPAFLYPLPIPDLRKLVLNLTEGKSVLPAPINKEYMSMSFPTVSLHFHNRNPVGLLILVKSTASNVANRDAYRSTWANYEYLSKFDIPIAYAFLIGSGQYFGSIPEELRNESMRHEDIIFMDFVETYRNNTYKTLGGFKWALELRPEFEFLVMIDDDLYFSVGQAVRFLKYPHLFNVSISTSITSKFGAQISPDNSFYASVTTGGYEVAMPVRNSSWQKWYVSWEEYPFEKLPNYPSGMTVFYSRSAVREIYTASPYVKHLSVDDAYVGIIAAKLGLELTDLNEFILNEVPRERIPMLKGDALRQLISWHIPHDISKRLAIWHEANGS